jgi:adenylate cyclase
VSDLSVALESIRACFAGVFPTQFATCSPDGTPNVIAVSLVHYVDSERVAVSRQFLRKTSDNVEANRKAQLFVTDPQTFAEYRLDTEFLHTETEGPAFEAAKANLDAVASQSGMSDVFRLRGVDIHRVIRCEAVGHELEVAARPAGEPDALGPVDEFVRRLGLCADYEELTRAALRALEDLFGVAYSILLLADAEGGGLFATASNGYPASAVGAEVRSGVGLIGTAAAERRSITIAHLGRARKMQAALRASAERDGDGSLGPEISLPGLALPQSVAAIPLIAQNRLVGVLYLESERPGQFHSEGERTWQIIAGYLAATLLMLEAEPHPSQPAGVPAKAVPAADARTVTVDYYQANDSVFVAGRYVTKGVAGRILRKLAGEHVATGRTAFSNRELRLDESLGLPAGADNLEGRLLVLRRRLALQNCGIELERIGRGHMELRVAGPLELCDIPTTGPMRAAYGG